MTKLQREHGGIHTTGFLAESVSRGQHLSGKKTGVNHLSSVRVKLNPNVSRPRF